MKRAPAAVIFDMDGLLFDTEALSRRSWQRAARERGYELPAELYNQVIGRPVGTSHQVFREHFGANFPSEEIRARRVQYSEEYIEQHGVPVKDGVFEVFDWLDQAAIPFALATSTQREIAESHLQRVDILGRFAATVTGDEIARGKPNPDIFLVAAERLGTAATACLVFEDSEAGVRAAHAAQMQVIAVPDLVQPSDEVQALATAVVASLHDGLEILQSFFEK